MVKMDDIEHIRRLVPKYEQDLDAIGENRQAEDPDPRPWFEVHDLDPDTAEGLVADAKAEGR